MQNTVFITGGGGFLGSRIASTFREHHDVVVLCRQSGQIETVQEVTGCQAMSADIVDIGALRAVMHAVQPDIVVHTAGIKTVSEAEQDPLSCADVNVVGSQNVARTALEIGCRAVVGISTNRAAPPTVDTYGLSKAIVERMFCSLNEKSDTKFTSIRLGNIAWSTGSVLPAWESMLRSDDVIGSRGPEMRRFLLSAGDAVELVRVCLDNLDELQGKVVAKRMKQTKILDLLNAFIGVHGGSWTKIDGEPGDLVDETLVGELELPYCQEQTLGGNSHYVLSFNAKANTPLSGTVTTKTAEALSEAELRQLVTPSPDLVPAIGVGR